MKERPLRVLLIEHKASEARLLQQLLEKNAAGPVMLEQVDSLSAGLETLSRVSFDAVLLDLSLPHVTSVEGVLKIQNEAPQIPVVVLADQDQEGLALKAIRQGALDFVVKGQIDTGSLVRVIHYAVERGRDLRRWETSNRVIDRVPQAIYAYDVKEKQIVYSNQRFAELVGIEEVEDRSRRCWPLDTLMHPDDFMRFDTHIDQLTEADGDPAIKVKFRLKQCDETFLEVTGLERIFSCDEQGSPLLIVGTITVVDMPPGKATPNWQPVTALMDLVPDCLYAKDLEGQFVYANSEHLRFLNAGTQKEVIGKTEYDFLRRQTAGKICDEDRKIIRKGRSVFGRKEVYQSQDGKEQCFVTSKTLLRDEEGRTIGLGVIRRDETPLFQVEQTLQQTRQKLEAVSERLDHFTHVVSSVLQEQFSDLVTNLQLLEQTSNKTADAESSDLVRNSLHEVRRAESLIRSVLGASDKGIRDSELALEIRLGETADTARPSATFETADQSEEAESRSEAAGENEVQDSQLNRVQMLIAAPVMIILLGLISYVAPFAGFFSCSVLGVAYVAWKAFGLGKKKPRAEASVP